MKNKAFTLIELLVVIAIVAILAAILFPVFAQAKTAAKKTQEMAQMRQLAVAAQLYSTDNDGALYHHHEQWVLDDGTLVDTLPSTVAGCAGGGFGNSQAERPWAIIFQPYLKGREMLFSPGDPAPRSRKLAISFTDYDGTTPTSGGACGANPDSELCQATTRNLSMWSFALNSVFTHKSCQYAVQGALNGFATESTLAGLENPNLIMFSPRNSVGMIDPGAGFYAPGQDDYDTWSGEGALIKWGSGSRPNEGWIAKDRFNGVANYVYADFHAKALPWSKARLDQFPDHIVRGPVN